MSQGWKIITLHDLSWIKSPYADPLGGQLNPDQFEELVHFLGNEFELKSPVEALKAIEAGKTPDNWLSFWFDDGFSGVRLYAEPILKKYGLNSIQSVTGSLVNGKPTWRHYQAATVDLERAFSRTDTLNQFNLKETQNKTFNQVSSFWPFDNWEQTKALKAKGWGIGNHTMNHYPIGEKTAACVFVEEFAEMNELMEKANLKSPFLVLPFDRENYRVEQVFEQHQAQFSDQYLVLMGNRKNVPENIEKRVIYRYYLPSTKPKETLNFLHNYNH